MSIVYLDHYHPGVLASISVFDVPKEIICENGIEIERDFDCITLDINYIIDKLRPYVPPPVVSDSAIPHKSNRFDDIIDRLERKYCLQSNLLQSSNSSICNHSIYSYDDEKCKDKRKQRKMKDDDENEYDYDDPFIDDSEHVADVDQILRMKSAKTKFDGFFVSSESTAIISEPDKKEVSSVKFQSDPYLCQLSDIENDNDEEAEKLDENNTQDVQSLNTVMSLLPLSIQTALEVLQQRTIRAGLSLSRNSPMPIELESEIISLFSLVRSDCKARPGDIKSFVESIQYILGSEISYSRIKSFLNRLEIKERINQIRLLLDNDMEKLSSHMKLNILPNNVSSSILPSSSSSSPPIMVSEDHISDLSKESSEVVVECIVKSEENQETEVVDAVKYRWKMRWKMNMRSLLIAIESRIQELVRLENQYRSLLTAVDRKCRPAQECCQLNEKDEITFYFKKLISVAPEDCWNGDLSTLRKQLSMEKSRLRRLSAKTEASMGSENSLDDSLGPLSSYPAKDSSNNSKKDSPSCPSIDSKAVSVHQGEAMSPRVASQESNPSNSTTPALLPQVSDAIIATLASNSGEASILDRDCSASLATSKITQQIPAKRSRKPSPLLIDMVANSLSRKKKKPITNTSSLETLALSMAPSMTPHMISIIPAVTSLSTSGLNSPPSTTVSSILDSMSHDVPAVSSEFSSPRNSVAGLTGDERNNTNTRGTAAADCSKIYPVCGRHFPDPPIFRLEDFMERE